MHVMDREGMDSLDAPDRDRIALSAERLVPGARRVCGRVAVISRRIVTVRTTIDVDVSHEELVIDYVDGDGESMDDTAVQPITLDLLAEEIVVMKHLRVVEKVTIGTTRVTGTERLEATLRREELDVRKAGDTGSSASP